MSQIIAGQLVQTGQFCTVTFVTNDGSIRKLNGRTGVTKYNKGSQSTVDHSKYFLVYTRDGSVKFDAARMVNKKTIISIKAHGVKAEKNNNSVYAATL